MSCVRQLTYIIQWHATSYTSCSSSNSSSSSSSSINNNNFRSQCDVSYTAERAPPAGDENNRQPQRNTNSRATEYRELSSYTSWFIVTINNRLYFEDNVTWLYINCVLRLLNEELQEINLYLYSCEQRRPGYHLAEVRLQHYTTK